MQKRLALLLIAVGAIVVSAAIKIALSRTAVHTSSRCQPLPAKPLSQLPVSPSKPIASPVPELGPPPKADAAPPPSTSAGVLSPGVQKISEILANQNRGHVGAVNELLKVLPSLPENEQIECAQHIANLSGEETFRMWGQLLEQNQLPKAAAMVLLNDLLNRPRAVGMPIVAAIADQPSHPAGERSRKALQELYGPPPQGTEWKQWVKHKADESPLNYYRY